MTQTELRLRCALAAHLNWNWNDLMDFAIVHCLPFRIIMTPISKSSPPVAEKEIQSDTNTPHIDHENL